MFYAFPVVPPFAQCISNELSKRSSRRRSLEFSKSSGLFKGKALAFLKVPEHTRQFAPAHGLSIELFKFRGLYTEEELEILSSPRDHIEGKALSFSKSQSMYDDSHLTSLRASSSASL